MDKGNTAVVMDKTDLDKRLVTTCMLEHTVIPHTKITNEYKNIPPLTLKRQSTSLSWPPKTAQKKNFAATHRIFHRLSDLQLIKRPSTNS